MYHHALVQANAVPQRAARVLVPRPLNYSLSDAVAAHVAPRDGGASVLGGFHEASETLGSSLALWHHALVQADAVSQRAARVLVTRPLNYRVSDAVSMHAAPRDGGASVSGANGMLAAYGTLSRSLAMYYHALMQANAVSQRAARVLVPRPLNYRVSDAVSMHAAPRNGDASVSGAYWVHEASETLGRSLALRHHALVQANAVSQRAERVLVPRPLNYSLSDAVAAHVALRNVAHLFRGQMGCLQRMGHKAGAWRCTCNRFRK
jgi:hypothetical protein